MLMEHETEKIRELDSTYQTGLQEWKSNLRPRKQVLLLFLSCRKSICVEVSIGQIVQVELPFYGIF